MAREYAGHVRRAICRGRKPKPPGSTPISTSPRTLKEIFTGFRVGHPDKIGDRPAYALNCMRQGQPPVRLYFDQSSGLLLRQVRYTDTPVGRNPTQIDYADYREVDGVKVPFRWTLARVNGRFTIQIQEAKQNVPIDDAKFAKPDAKPSTQ
jgi:photosynthetic reaction center cytochrome c subunit